MTFTPGMDAYEWARGKVDKQDVWAVLIVNGNATMRALRAVEGVVDGGSYDRESSRSTYILSWWVGSSSSVRRVRYSYRSSVSPA